LFGCEQWYCRYRYSADLTENVRRHYDTCFVLLPICTVATAVKTMCQYCSTVTACDSNPHCHYISAHCYQLLNCTVATAVKAMCQYCSTVTVCHSNPQCHYINAHCYQLLNCTVATVQLLYSIRIPSVTISVNFLHITYFSFSL
jgi:hypothetical protein